MNEAEKIENLLKPRYKVIADYPCSTHKVGDIIEAYDTAMDYAVEMGDKQDGTYQSEKICMLDYPHLFKKLEWFEDRDEKDMPEFIKHKVSGQIVDWGEQSKTTPSNILTTDGWWNLYDCVPASHDEYLEYLKEWSKQNQ